MWLAVCATVLLAVLVVGAVVPICDLPYSPYSDEFTVLQALKMAGKAELRKRRTATARDVKLLMLGLDGSGKSSLVEYWLRGKTSSKPPAPTTGFNIQELNEPQPWWAWKGGVRFNVWELGGAAAIRPYWHRCAPPVCRPSTPASLGVSIISSEAASHLLCLSVSLSLSVSVSVSVSVSLSLVLWLSLVMPPRYFDDPRTGPARAVVPTPVNMYCLSCLSVWL